MGVDHQPEDIIINANFFLASWSMLCVVISYIVSQSRKALFLSEKNLAIAKDEAESANAVKSSFLAMMSHEVRTPLNGILGIVNLLQDTRLDGQQKNYAQTIQYSGEALQVLLNDILDFSKIEAGKMEIERVDFNLAILVVNPHLGVQV